MTFYSDMATTALELITEFGQAVTITRKNERTLDPVEGEYLPDDLDDLTTDYAGYAAAFDYDLKESGISNADGSIVKQGDKKILLAASGLEITPLLTDTITVDSITYSIINIKSVNPAGTAVMYEIQGRI